MRFKAVIFDLDATLVDLGGHVDWRAAQRRAAEVYREWGCSEDRLTACGPGLFNMLAQMHGENRSSLGPAKADMIQAAVYAEVDSYESAGAERCTQVPGAEDALRWLAARGTKVGVCTSNSPASASCALKRLGLDCYVSVAVGRTPGLRLKPSPDQVIECLRLLGADPERAVMVGDSHGDVLAGKAAGARTVAVPVYFTRMRELEAAAPDAVIKSLSELPAAVLTLEEAAGMRTGSRGPERSPP